MQLVQLHTHDIPSLVELSATLGWDYSTEDLTTIFASGIAYGHKTETGQLLSSAAVFPYGPELASLGMVMVDPEHRRKGLGQTATQKVMESLPDKNTPIMLVATQQGYPMYEKMGYRTIGTLHKFIAETYQPHEDEQQIDLTGYQIQHLTHDNFAEILRLDTDSLGTDRKTFLQARLNQSQTGVILRRTKDNTAAGFALSIPGTAVTILGPVTAPNPTLAFALIDHLARQTTAPLRIDIPSEQTALIEKLPAHGFTLQTQPPVMLWNAEHLPPRNNTLFGIAAQAFG